MNNRDKVSIADQVAEELLEKVDKKDKHYIILLLTLLLLLVLFISTLSFALFNVYHKGGYDNNISVGSILFSYNQGENSISIKDAYPVSDEIGMNYNADNQYFDFYVSVGYYKRENIRNTDLYYEISLTPDSSNTLDGKYIRVNLRDNNENVNILNNNIVAKFSDLPNSKIRRGSKLLYSTKVNKNAIHNYQFRMWLANDYQVDEVSRIFKVYVSINAYQK